MGSFYDDFKKKQNKSQNKPTLIKVPQVAPKSNDRRATAARNREQQRVQAHGGQTQTTQRVNTQQRTTVRQNTSAGSSQRSTPIVQRTQSTQQNSFGLRSPQQLLNSAQSSSIANVNRFSAKQAAQQRRNPRQNPTGNKQSTGDGNPMLTQFLKNSMDWHRTSDPNRKAQLHAQNDALRRKLGYEYNPQTGASFDKFGHEMTVGVRMAYNSTPTERLNQATKLLHTSGVMGKTDKATVYPTAMQAAQGLDEDYFSGQTGYNAHKTMHDLFNRSDETWSSEDTQSRDRARKELSNEMSRIMKRYGLDYQPRDNADDIMNRLKAAGADEQTLAYVQENIDLRHAADRLGNSMEAVGKRWIASLPSLVDTSRQVSANVEESRQNEEYRQLEEQEQQLELQLQGMNSTAADGSVPADYQAMYDQLQDVRKRKNELTVNKGVDPNKWSQRMLREANAAQANAEAGLAPAPRWLTEQGISLAGNAPVMAASAIPVVGPAVGSIMMGGQAAGQRSFELNEQGKGARESLTRGLTSGAIEAATERLPLGQMSKILHSGGVNAVKNILIQMGEEATEESASYFLNYVADLAANDPDAKFSLAELTQSAAGGAFGGLVFGTAGAVGSRSVYGSPTENQLTNRPMTEYEAHADTPYLQVERFTEPLTQTMVKIDEQMRKAETLPEGTIKQQYTAALQEDAQRVSKQLSILENNRAELMQARNIAERFGAKFELADLGPAGGKYENGTITVNPYSSSPVRQVLVHTFGFTPEQIAKGTVPLSDAMQYGKTPEQAVMEANARAEGERARNGYEKGETMSFMTGTKMGYPSDTVSPDGSDIPSVDNSISPNAENGNTEVKPLGNYEMYGKSREQAMRELQNKLTEKRSFLHDDDYKQVRAVQSAELRETWEQARPVHEQIEKFQKNHPLSAKDEQLLQAAMVNGATNTFSQCDDPAAVMHRYQLQQELNRRMQPIKDYQRTRGETMALNAEEMADTIAEFAKDKKIPGAYSRETMERNSYDIFGKDNRDKAEQLNDEYFAPVHKAVADRTNYVNTMRQQVADLHLSKHESALVQMALEGRNDVAAEYIKNNKIKVTSKLQKNVADGVATFQAIYKELYEAINETLLSNGMEPVRTRKNYAPHFVKDKPDTMLGRIRFALGLGKDSSVNIGTDIAGITDDFSPGKKWFGNLLQRDGELTDYDAVAGFDRYIETAGDVIFLTDSVQQLRSLEDALRYRLSDEGTREMVNQIRNDRSLNALERHQKIQDAYDSNTDNIQKLYNQKKQGMGGYVSNLHEYINNLAGKKARADRGWEEMIGRQMYTVAKNVEGRVAANMIAMNPGSWITNFIPITQASGEVSTANLIKAMRDTVKSAVKDDGFTVGSVFLTNREGTQFLDRTLTRKISDIAGMPMEAIDHFTSNVVTRAKYLQNIQDGMGLQEAFDNADTFAANLMADRSKGAQPTAFNSVNPVRKVFTMFQLEVNNQLSYLFKDLPRAKQSVPKLAWAYTKVFTGAYLFNAVYHQLTGRDSAFDPIGMIADAFGFDPFDDDDKDKKKKSGVDIALDLGENVAEQVPFVGGLLGGGRVPISSAFPDFGKLKEEYENGYDKKRIALDAAKSAANSAAYLLLPFGGGAVKKALGGAATVYAGGSYSLDKNGEKILQFPQYGQSPRDWAQAMLFGKSSLQGAQEWADDDYNSLNADETKVFEELRQRMSWNKDENGNTIDNSEAVFAAIKAMKATTADAKKKYGLQNYKEIAAASIRKMLLENNDLTPMQKKTLDRQLITAGDTADYTSQDAFTISQYVRESRQDDAAEAIKHGISVDDFVKWDSVIEQTLADNYVDAKDYEDGENNQLYAKNAVLQNILDEFDKDGEHTDAEKNAFADYVLVSAMGESDKERWDAVKGTVNATDFVKFAGDMATYNKEYKGSGMSKSDAMQAILNGYGNLSDTQKDALFGAYSDSASGNAFHISKYQYAGGEFANPVEGGTIPDGGAFGPRKAFTTSNGATSSKWHKSIDIAAPAGTAIKSVQGGKVTANGWVSGYGWTIEVTHDNGYVSMYHHMQNQSSVAVGTEVKQGQTIGNVGSTGNSTGPHLDLTITKDGTPVDPASLIGDYKNAKTGYVYEGSPVYTQLSSAAGKKSSSGGSRKSGGSSSGGLKQLKGLSGLKGLGF